MMVEKNQWGSSKSPSSSSVYQMMDWFGLTRCLILSPHQLTIPSQSARRVLYSAAVCAASALHCNIPVFVISTTVDALHRAREILGYALAPSDVHGWRDEASTVHYESALLEGVVSRHALFYLDGLLGLFGSKLSEFSNCRLHLTNGTGLANIKEKYFYKLSDTDKFLTRSVAYNNDSKKLRLHPEIQSCVEDLGAAFPDRDDTSASLNKLAIEINYGFRKFGVCQGREHNIDDNEYYTTLHPSALPFESWEVHAEFLPLRNSSDLEPQGLAYCLRQLLALYIAGKCCVSEHSVGNMSGKNGDFPSVDRAKALSVATVLSIRSRDAVSAVCVNTLPNFVDEFGNPIGSGGSIPQDLLMRVFSRSMWVDIDIHQSGLNACANQRSNTSAVDGAQEKEDRLVITSDYYGLSTSPWNWMANLGGAPVGSWLNLVAVYTGSLPDFCSMCYFWAECCHQLRVHSETGVPVPRLHPPQPVSSPGETSGIIGDQSSDGALSRRSRSVLCLNTDVEELWEQSLWDDVLDTCADKHMPFSLPDTSRCLIFQKLQMLQLCILCEEEKITFDRASSSAFLNRRDNGADMNEPRLQRRLPMTTDMNAHTQYLQDKLSSGRSRTGNDNPLLRWQVALPSVVSDARAFKASNPVASFEDFMLWYSPCRLPVSTLQEIWTFCAPAHAEEQNALFKSEKEAEKVLGFLESLTPCQLTAEMLCTAMTSMHMVLYFDLLGTISSSNGGAIHSTLLHALKDEISAAVEMIREDCPNLHDSPDTSISQHALLAVDKVCNSIQSLEETKARADSCRLQFDHNQTRLRTELSVYGRAAAINNEEAAHLFLLSKNASRGGNHSWHSVDGRELGVPDVKNFDIWSLSDSVADKVIGMLCADEGAATARSGKLVQQVLDEEASKSSQRMHATASGDELRVSLILHESSMF